MNVPPSDPPIPLRSTSESEPAVELVEFDDEPGHTPSRPAAGRRHGLLRRRARLSAVLFCLTAVSVVAAGSYLGSGLLLPVEFLLFTGQLPLPTWAGVREGFIYGGCLLLILLAHEMGHFLQAVRHRVPATLPFFIPFPISPFGTMGAVIVQDGSRADRRQLFDIAVAGPLAGLAIALPVTWYGVSISSVQTFPPGPGSVHYGNPLLLDWIVTAIHGPYGENQDITLNAPIFAGWVGIFITALNLMPVGQLDGGHILYTLVGRKAHYVAYAVLGGAVAWMALTYRLHYALIVVLLLVFGPKHPPTRNDDVPLGWGRTILGWATLAFIAIGFTPTPIVM